jgi:hypothetical protein
MRGRVDLAARGHEVHDERLRLRILMVEDNNGPPSGACFEIIEIAKRFDIAQTRGHNRVWKSPVKISVIICTISAKFNPEF